MSNSDALDRPAETLTHASKMLMAALNDPDRIPDAEFRALMDQFRKAGITLPRE